MPEKILYRTRRADGRIVLMTAEDIQSKGLKYQRAKGGSILSSAVEEATGDPTTDTAAKRFSTSTGTASSGSGASGPISNKITFSSRGAALQWSSSSTSGVKGYHIERSHESGATFPDWSYLRVTATPLTGNTYQDLWAWEDEAVRYRIYAVQADNSLVLHTTLTGTQTAFTGTYRTTQLVIDDTNTQASGTTIFEDIHFRTGERVNCIQVNTTRPVLIRNCTARTSGDFCRGNGGAKVRLENNYVRGKVPTTADYSAGLFFRGDYLAAFAGKNNIIREMGGYSLGQFRGPTKANGGLPTDIQGNVFWNLHRKRSNGSGGDRSLTTIVSSHKEGSTRGLSDPNQTGGQTLPIGWEFAQAIVLNGTGNKVDGLPAAHFGGMEIKGNFVLQEPGIGLAEDLFNFYQQGGESWDAPLAIRGWFVWGNYGNGINDQGQLWSSGMAWPMGGQKQPGGTYTFGYQSMTGGLQQDGHDTTNYAANGAYTIVEDAWLLGGGSMVGAQHSHDHRIVRAKVIYTGKMRDGVTSHVGDSRTGVYMHNFTGSATVDGKPLWDNNGIKDSHTIKPTDLNLYPQGFSTEHTDAEFTTNNTVENRFATAAEEKQAHLDFLAWCAARSIRLGPVWPAPAVS